MPSPEKIQHNVFTLLDEKEREFIQRNIFANKIRAGEAIFSQNLPKSFNYKSLMLALPAKIAELATFQIELQELAEGKNLEPIFLSSKDGALLSAAWNAILNADIEALPTFCSYAPQDLSKSELAYKLFSKLLQNAGIAMLSDGWSAGMLTGECHGSYTFVLDSNDPNVTQTGGLLVSFDHKFDGNKETDEQTFTSALVTGTLKTKPFGSARVLEPSKEPITDPLAVGAMALVFADKLKAHYKLESAAAKN